MSIEQGQPFPSFTGLSQDGESVNLADYRGDENLVVFFYPRAQTSGCVRETTEFGARREEFDALKTKIVGVSVDEVAAQKRHSIQCAASFPVLSDESKALTGELGILSERGTAMRTTYLIDRNGTVQKVFNGVRVDGHVDEVLQAVKGLGGAEQN